MKSQVKEIDGQGFILASKETEYGALKNALEHATAPHEYRERLAALADCITRRKAAPAEIPLLVKLAKKRHKRQQPDILFDADYAREQIAQRYYPVLPVNKTGESILHQCKHRALHTDFALAVLTRQLDEAAARVRLDLSDRYQPVDLGDGRQPGVLDPVTPQTLPALYHVLLALTDQDERTALHAMVSGKTRWPVIEGFFRRAGQDPNLLTVKDQNHHTLLHVAVSNQRRRCFNKLLDLMVEALQGQPGGADSDYFLNWVKAKDKAWLNVIGLQKLSRRWTSRKILHWCRLDWLMDTSPANWVEADLQKKSRIHVAGNYAQVLSRWFQNRQALSMRLVRQGDIDQRPRYDVESNLRRIRIKDRESEYFEEYAVRAIHHEIRQWTSGIRSSARELAYTLGAFFLWFNALYEQITRTPSEGETKDEKNEISQAIADFLNLNDPDDVLYLTYCIVNVPLLILLLKQYKETNNARLLTIPEFAVYTPYQPRLFDWVIKIPWLKEVIYALPTRRHLRDGYNNYFLWLSLAVFALGIVFLHLAISDDSNFINRNVTITNYVKNFASVVIASILTFFFIRRLEIEQHQYEKAGQLVFNYDGYYPAPPAPESCRDQFSRKLCQYWQAVSHCFEITCQAAGDCFSGIKCKRPCWVQSLACLQTMCTCCFPNSWVGKPGDSWNIKCLRLLTHCCCWPGFGCHPAGFIYPTPPSTNKCSVGFMKLLSYFICSCWCRCTGQITIETSQGGDVTKMTFAIPCCRSLWPQSQALDGNAGAGAPKIAPNPIQAGGGAARPLA